VALDPEGRLARLMHRAGSNKRFLRIAPRIMPRVDRAVSRLTRGRMVPSDLLVPTLMLTHTGAKSGLERKTPLATLADEGGWYVTGSNYGGEKHPAWSGNLMADPRAVVTFRGRTTPVVAHLLTEEEKAAVWPKLLTVWPIYDTYVERSGRSLRVFRLEPSEPQA
jgi:deazaflavin-dependent oxidoreductase (nitroreductase family)